MIWLMVAIRIWSKEQNLIKFWEIKHLKLLVFWDMMAMETGCFPEILAWWPFEGIGKNVSHCLVSANASNIAGIQGVLWAPQSMGQSPRSSSCLDKVFKTWKLLILDCSIPCEYLKISKLPFLKTPWENVN